jgi:hypothetical protein
MSVRWLLAQRPRSAAEVKKRGLTGRRLSREEIAAEAAKLGMPVYGERRDRLESTRVAAEPTPRGLEFRP